MAIMGKMSIKDKEENTKKSYISPRVIPVK